MKQNVDVRVVLMRDNKLGGLERVGAVPASMVVPAVMALSSGSFTIDLCSNITFPSVPEKVDGFGLVDLDGELLYSQYLTLPAYVGDTVNITAGASLDDDVPTGTLAPMTTDTDEMTMDEWLDAAPVPGEAMEVAAAVDAAEDALEELVAWLREQEWSNFAQSLCDFYDDRGFLSPKQVASATSMRTKCEAKAAKPKAPPVTEDGMYLHPDGTVYKVQIAHHGSGRLYAKRLVVGATYADAARFEFDSGAIYRLSPSMKMTLEQAQAFGSLYGVCCVCAAVLTNEQSIADGIGPVCRTRVF